MPVKEARYYQSRRNNQLRRQKADREATVSAIISGVLMILIPCLMVAHKIYFGQKGKEIKSMRTWKKDIRILGDDFGLSRSLIKCAIKKAEEKAIPQFYNGNEDNFRYNEAHRIIMPYILDI